MKKMIQKAGAYVWKVVLINISVLRSVSWIITDDLTWFLSRENFSVDTFVLRKKVEGTVIKFLGSVFLNCLL